MKLIATTLTTQLSSDTNNAKWTVVLSAVLVGVATAAGSADALSQPVPTGKYAGLHMPPCHYKFLS